MSDDSPCALHEQRTHLSGAAAAAGGSAPPRLLLRARRRQSAAGKHITLNPKAHSFDGGSDSDSDSTVASAQACAWPHVLL